MTDEQLQDWHTTFLSEAQRENYVNHNLEIVRHYRTEAIARAPAFDLERNAIDAAIARHGLYMSSANEGAAETTAAGNGIGSGGGQDEALPPPQRRPRIEQQQSDDPTCSTRSSSTSGGCGGVGGASSSSVGMSSVTGTAASNYGHFVALAHIFDSYATRAEPARAVSAGIGEVPIANGNNSSNKDREDAAAVGAAAVADISDMAISKTVDSLGLRRSH